MSDGWGTQEAVITHFLPDAAANSEITFVSVT